MPDDVSLETNDDLRSELERAWDKAEAAEAPEADAEAAPAPEAQGETAEARAERVRDEKGRFTKAEQAAQKAAKADPAQPLENQPQTGQAPLAPAAAANTPVGPPTSWSIAAKAEFDKLSQPVRDAIAKREQEMANGIAEYQQRTAAYKGLEPYAEMATKAGTTLPQAVQEWMNAEELLHRDFEQGMLSLCQHFNVNPQALAARWAGGGSQQPNGQGSQIPPQVQQEINALKAYVEADRRAREQEQWSGVTSEIESFAAKPENKYFENVRPFMAKLLQAEAATTLKDAYDQACWAHPEIRQLLLNEQQAAKTAAAQRTASEARRAAGSLNPGSPFPGTTTNSGSQNRTLRDELLAAYDAHTV